MSKYNLYLNLIQEMCKKLEETDLKKLENDMIWDATLMRLQVIGENSKKISPEIKNRHKDVEWKNLEWFRNVVSHEYRRVLPEVVEGIIKKEIPILKKIIKQIKKELNEK